MILPIYKSDDLLLLLRKKNSALIFPTDTLPALATLPENAEILWKIKNRPTTKPFILMGSSAEQLLKFVLPKSLPDSLKICSSYWPGALTIILPASGEILKNLNPFGNSIGLRVPACKRTIEFLEKSGPLATTSANLSGEKPAVHPNEIHKCFPEIPLLGPLPWPKASGLASTLIEWKGPGMWHLIRQGSLIPSEIFKK